MKLAVLFSGGKDSSYAMHKAMKYHDIACLITIKSQNKESYMFHTPNIELTKLQSDAIGLPLITAETEGEKEAELKELRVAIEKAAELFGIEGIVTGAIESVYQAARIQKICSELGMWCFNPLWQMDQTELLGELIESRFEVIISAVAAYPLDEGWLGRKIDRKTIEELSALQEKYKLNPAGEGGEFESFVLDAPFFRKRIVIEESSKKFSKNNGIFEIKKAVLR